MPFHVAKITFKDLARENHRCNLCSNIRELSGTTAKDLDNYKKVVSEYIYSFGGLC